MQMKIKNLDDVWSDDNCSQFYEERGTEGFMEQYSTGQSRGDSFDEIFIGCHTLLLLTKSLHKSFLSFVTSKPNKINKWKEFHRMGEGVINFLTF